MSNAQAILERYERIRRDPWEFLRTCVFTLDQVDKANPVKLFPSHFDYLYVYTRCWERYSKIAVPKSRRMTMSWTNIALFLWDAMFHKGRFLAFVSRKEEAADELVTRAKFIYDHIPEDAIPRDLLPRMSHKFCNIIFPEIDSHIQGFPQGADQLRQFTFTRILGDEIAFWEKAQEMYSASLPTLEGGGQFVGISSPGPGFFKMLVHDELDLSGTGQIFDKPKKTGTLVAFAAAENVKNRFPMEGVEVWINPGNKFLIFKLHYTANPLKRDASYRDSVKSAMPRGDYLREYELQWDTYSGLPVYTDYSEKFHGSKTRLHPEIGLPLLRGWDFGLCYDDETEVLTKAGWKLFRDVSETEPVGALDPETFELRYEVPRLKVAQPYKGEMIVWDSQNLQACVTPDHIVPVWKEDSHRLERYYARDLLGASHNLIRLTANWKGADEPNPLKLSPKLFAAFMGAYLSEGSCEEKRTSLYQIEANKAWMREILRATEWDWRESEKTFRLYNPEIATYLSQFGTAEFKFVPDEIRFGSPGIITEFIRTYTLGDGHIRTRENGSEEHTIYSKSKRMIDDLSELALKIGWTSSVTEVEPATSYYEIEDRWITSTGGWSIHFKKTSDWSYLRTAKKTTKLYDGMVYCLSVSTGILCVRKNGRPHFNGNTPACLVAQLQGDRLVVLWEKVSQNMGLKRFAEQALGECKLLFPEWSDPHRDWRDFADPSGVARKDTDEGTCFKLLSDPTTFNLRVQGGAIDWESRRSSVEHFLCRTSKDGPALHIDLDRCPVFAAGLRGGYRYPERTAEIEPTKIRPLKDAHSHVQDAFQMITSRLVRAQAPKRKPIPGPAYSWTGADIKPEVPTIP